MATLLDAGIVTYFGPIFVVLLIFVVVYGILEWVKPFGSGKMGIHAIIALCCALLLIMSGLGTKMVTTMMPWFIVGMIFLFFFIVIIRMFNVSEGDLRGIISRPDVYTWIVIFGIILLLSSLSAVFGQSFLEAGNGAGAGGNNYNATSAANPPQELPGTRSTTTTSFSTNMMNTLRNPKVLGMVFIFLVGAFSMFFLTKSVSVG